jgi:hypothetical protein
MYIKVADQLMIHCFMHHLKIGIRSSIVKIIRSPDPKFKIIWMLDHMIILFIDSLISQMILYDSY